MEPPPSRPARRPVGWIEEYDVQRGTWTALIDSSIVADAPAANPCAVPARTQSSPCCVGFWGTPHSLVKRARPPWLRAVPRAMDSPSSARRAYGRDADLWC
ncbi:hypothetical protein BOQ63_006415 (plasmid) [Streptomyces viridifaciens]|nr:hypothetical protein BOQ63_006415 [Streptomyces viridifaciens]